MFHPRHINNQSLDGEGNDHSEKDSSQPDVAHPLGDNCTDDTNNKRRDSQHKTDFPVDDSFS